MVLANQQLSPVLSVYLWIHRPNPRYILKIEIIHLLFNIISRTLSHSNGRDACITYNVPNKSSFRTPDNFTCTSKILLYANVKKLNIRILFHSDMLLLKTKTLIAFYFLFLFQLANMIVNKSFSLNKQLCWQN